ncbi:MAG: YdbH domain-containing protein, partial [Pseudomonadota bacterium]
MLKHLLLTLVVLAALTLSLSAVLLKTADRWLPALAQRVLENQGVKHVSVKGLTTAWGALYATEIDLQLLRPAETISLSISELSITLEPEALLRGQLTDVAIAKLDARISGLGDTANTPDSPIIIEQLLPQEWLGLLPMRSLTIHELLLQYDTPEREVLELSGDLRLTDELNAQLAIQWAALDLALTLTAARSEPVLFTELMASYRQGTLINATLKFERDQANSWLAQIDASLAHSPLLDWVNSPEAAFTTRLPNDLSIDGQSRVESTVALPNRFTLQADHPLYLLAQVTAQALIESQLTHVSYPPHLEDGAGLCKLQLGYERGDWSLVTDAGQFSGQTAAKALSLDSDTLAWLALSEQLPVSISWGEGHVSHAGNNSLASLKGVHLDVGGGPSSIALEDAAASVEYDHDGELQVSFATELVSRLRGSDLPTFKLSLGQRGPLDASKIEATLEDETPVLQLTSKGTLNLNSRTGQQTVTLAIDDVGAGWEKFGPLVDRYSGSTLPLKLSSGEITLISDWSRDATTDSKWLQQSKLRSSSISGVYDDFSFQNLSLSGHWQGLERWQTLTPFTLTMTSVNVGFPLNPIEARLSLPTPTPYAKPAVLIEDFWAGMFGGRLQLTEPTRWDFASGRNALTLEVQNWRLSELVALQQDENIEATGILQGLLPVTLNAGEVEIDRGYLNAKAPGGRIKYGANEAAQALASSSTDLSLALD